MVRREVWDYWWSLAVWLPCARYPRVAVVGVRAVHGPSRGHCEHVITMFSPPERASPGVHTRTQSEIPTFQIWWVCQTHVLHWGHSHGYMVMHARGRTGRGKPVACSWAWYWLVPGIHGALLVHSRDDTFFVKSLALLAFRTARLHTPDLTLSTICYRHLLVLTT